MGISRVTGSAAAYIGILVAVVGVIAGMSLTGSTAHATPGVCATADSVVSFTPGADIDPATTNDDPNSGLNYDGVFVSLGHGGEIVVVFTGVTVEDGAGDDLLIAESNAPDGAEILVSSDGVTYVSLGTHTVATEGYFDLAGTGLASINFVKIVDDNVDPELGLSSLEAGFDLDSVEAYNCGGPSPLDGRFTGGGHQVMVDGVRVTRGFTIHCDLLLSNNLEINWQGNKFHMLEHLTTVECSDDPAIIQAPPPSPVDTIVGTGTGRYNGVEGYSIVFTLVDAGEPGTNDMAAFEITAPDGVTTVLDVPLQTISGGNVQTHYDQPHK